ncbi:hypothetical protein [Thermaerobacillus caldiproteolyticus]|uniref:Uncharacterized protein n=1 Tax=Thermaerobacillus caldiproteolyticus TaxID=247480 RepID=A0A7V9Z3G2_9BACL|nr:hypothetical protein [Anoxybacillus caldiproteolyticus]MBA2873362.1 hypothetical protein [Anoxybacillus caldiproteolyticus]
MISDMIPNEMSTIERCVRGLVKTMQMIIEKHLGDFQQYAKQVLA